ncbi:hypothetical protein PABG_11478 [Paracoccidioides brasiliensis Pb03]|uniref:Uncharacterized protein n=1 Tax=Paracoccidioides brasiliensis TaxID=121759 RepID=A0A1D2JK02_PARBR|nr:hypothetical protein PABG_11478 [Paracoccidioides brasiliensis Pb03]ODH38889.1 hypothetical protein ACO22_02123 [Paracoccidioides brasiliensis]
MDKNKKPGMTIIHHCCNSSSAGIAQRQLLSQLHPREKFTTKCKKVREKKKVGAQWIPKLQSSQISQIKSYIRLVNMNSRDMRLIRSRSQKFVPQSKSKYHDINSV